MNATLDWRLCKLVHIIPQSFVKKNIQIFRDFPIVYIQNYCGNKKLAKKVFNCISTNKF